MGENSVLTKTKPSVGRSGKGRATSHDVRASTLAQHAMNMGQGREG